MRPWYQVPGCTLQESGLVLCQTVWPCCLAILEQAGTTLDCTMRLSHPSEFPQTGTGIVEPANCHLTNQRCYSACYTRSPT